MIGHVNTIHLDKQQGSMFKSLSLNLMHGVYEYINMKLTAENASVES